MNDNKRHLAFAILDFLNASIKDNTIKAEDAESMQVAIQCIGEAFKVDLENPQHRDQFTTKPASLLNIFDVFINAQKQKKTNVSTPAVPVQSNGQQDGDKHAEAESLKTQGNQKLAEKKFAEAVDLYTKAIDLNSLSAIYFSNRAAAYSSLAQYENAIDDCEMALSVDPKYAKAYSRMGLAYLSLGKSDKAVQAYKKGLAIDPANETMKQGLKSAQEADSKTQSKSVSGRSSSAGSGAASNPLANLAAGLGGGAGGFDIGSLLQNPAIMQMASQMMSNPQTAGMLNNLMGGAGAGGEGGGNTLENIMKNPALMDMAKQFAGDPKVADALKNIKPPQ